MKYLYETSTELKMSYIDKITFMNHVKNFAKENLGISSNNTPYILESYKLDENTNGSCTYLDAGFNVTEILYVNIRQELPLYQMISTILHETKHVQQHIRKPLYFRFAHKIKRALEKRDLYDGIFYTLALHEISARRYARKMMKKYNKELNALIEKAYNNELDQLLY
jgi:hypothetical protein